MYQATTQNALKCRLPRDSQCHPVGAIEPSRITRRALLGAAGAFAFSREVGAAGPAIHTKKRRVLRVLGTHVSLQDEIRRRAEAELGVELEFSIGGPSDILHRASTRPEAFDVCCIGSYTIGLLWQARAIQPLSVSRLQFWDEVNNLTKLGQLVPHARSGAGSSPKKVLYVQEDDSLSGRVTDRISFMPYIHNVDSFGYDGSQIPRGIPYQTESWAWLLDEAYAGEVAIVNEPSIGLFDLALAAQAKRLIEFHDIGNMTRRELDDLFEILLGYRQAGHFRGVWRTIPQATNMMLRREVKLQSMFSASLSELRASGVDCVYASPREGYRAWHGGICLSSQIDEATRDVAYKFMNWWLSGWPGAYLARQGFYISTPQRTREHLTDAEWDYWYEGKPAATDLRGTRGRIIVRRGQTRDGGSYKRRLSNIAVWNTVMPTYEHSLQRWNEFLSG